MLSYLRCLFLLAIAADLSAGDFVPNLGPDLPRIEVTCSDVTLLLRQASQWTPGRIDFQGKPMTTEKSAYGTVFSFPGTGFIGTGHLENEPEELTRVEFFLDGKKVEPVSPAMTGNEFRIERESRVRTLSLKSSVESVNDRLYETATVTADKATPQKLLYHFMHAWVPTASHFLAGSDAEPDAIISGELNDSEETLRKFYIQKPVDWIAIYDPASGQFGVSRLLEAPKEARNISMIWNVPPTYRKYYLKCFQDDTIPAGFDGTWRMVSAFGEAELADWETEAKKLAGELK